MFPLLDISEYPFLAIGHGPLFEFHGLDRLDWQQPELVLWMPGTSGFIDALTQFGFAVGNTNPGGFFGLGRAFFDNQFHCGQPAVPQRVVTVTDTEQGIAEAFEESLGAGSAGQEAFHGGAAVTWGSGWHRHDGLAKEP